MSAPVNALAAGDMRRESSFGVVGLGFALLLLAGLVALLFAPRTEPQDGNALLADWFALQEPLPGFAVLSAARLASREEIVRLVAPDARDPSDPSVAAEAAEADEDSAGTPAAGRAAGGAGGPDTLTFVRYPLASAAPILASLFRTPALGMGGENDRGAGGSAGAGGAGGPGGPGGPEAGGGDQVRDWSELDWHGYLAPYVLVRSKRETGTLDSVRVNLSQKGFACVLFATWPEGAVVEPEELEALLDLLQPGAYAR